MRRSPRSTTGVVEAEADVDDTAVHALLERAPCIFAEVAPSGALRYVSRLLPGHEHESFPRPDIYAYVAPEQHDELARHLARTADTGERGALVLIVPGEGGGRHRLQTRLFPVDREDGTRSVLLVLEEIDPAESNSPQSVDQLREAVAASEMGIWSWDSVGDRMVVDARVCEAFELEPAHAPRRYADYLDLVHPDDRQRVDRHLKAAREAGVLEDLEHRVATSNGEERWVLMRGTVGRGEGGSVRLQGGLLEITGRKRLEEQLRQAQKMEAVGQLTAGVAHNFNNMLMGILPNVELAARRAGADLVPLLTDALEAGERAAQLIKQLMIFAGQSTPESRTPRDPVELARSTLDICARTFDRRITLDLVVQATVPAVRVSPTDLQQALLNVCINSRDALETAPGEHPGICISVRRIGADDPAVARNPVEHVAIAVADTGPGMSAQVQERVFEPFYTTKPLGRGTGLGLSSTYAIVQDHGGWITCESAPGRGATFTLYLPAVLDEASASDDRRTAAARATVLVVDDEPLVRKVLRRMLDECGYRCLEAPEGQSGIALYRAHRREIDLVLLDHSMPGLSGDEVFAELKEIDPDVRVIFVTGYSARSRAVDGAEGVLEKPVRFEALRAELESALG